MSNCGTCKHFMAFEKKGIKEVPGDGMCMKNPNSDNWTFMLLSHCCIDYRSDITPITIQPMPSMVEKAKADIDALKKPGFCKDCSKWSRIGFSMAGKCYHNKDNPCNQNDNDACPQFYGKPNDNAHTGDIVRIEVGTEWKLLFVGKEDFIVEDREGKQQTFGKQGVRVSKC